MNSSTHLKAGDERPWASHGIECSLSSRVKGASSICPVEVPRGHEIRKWRARTARPVVWGRCVVITRPGHPVHGQGGPWTPGSKLCSAIYLLITRGCHTTSPLNLSLLRGTIMITSPFKVTVKVNNNVHHPQHIPPLANMCDRPPTAPGTQQVLSEPCFPLGHAQKGLQGRPPRSPRADPAGARPGRRRSRTFLPSTPLSAPANASFRRT